MELILTSVRALMMNVENPRYPFMIKPARIHLISDIPEPAAYFARVLTRCAARKEKIAYRIFRNCHLKDRRYALQTSRI